MRRLVVGVCALGILLTGCGGGDEDGPIAPPAPVAVATVTVTPAQLDLIVGETAQLTVVLADASGATLTGRTVTYASADAAIATVSNTGLVTATGKGGATITVTSEGRTGTSAATVLLPDFAPTANTTITGDAEFATLNVPAGVVVTITAAAEIVSEGAVTILGEISGDCTGITIKGTSVTVSGTLNNTCSANADVGPNLRIVANGDLTLTNAALGSSGDVSITNDETLSDADFDAALAAPRRAASFMGSCTVDGLVPVQGGIAKTTDGTASDTKGGDGQDSGNWLFDCNGDIDFENGGEIKTPNAGDGGNGNDGDASDPNKTEVQGGNGGNGGRLRVRSTGNINFKSPPAGGGPVRLLLSNGGRGGSATMVATSPGGSASAIGGRGGDSGNMRVQANGNINIQAGGLEIVVGRGGAGGNADAAAADGLDAGSAAAQPGGSATAVAGRGGDTPDAQLRARGNVTGAANITLSGGDGGNAGVAVVSGGKGGAGNADFPDGAIGGAMSATGGEGGGALTSGLAGVPLGVGGAGGEAIFGGGMGGAGFNGCTANPQVVGGNGGAGGAASGAPGTGGIGFNFGSDGDATVAAATGDGGAGGDGTTQGTGGAGGSDNIVTPLLGNRTDQGPNFQDGADGSPCNPVLISFAGLPDAFTHEVGVTPCPTVIGVITITNNTASDAEYSLSTSAPLGFEGTGTTAGGTIPAMSSVQITVIFDCSQTTSFTGTVSVSVTHSDGSATGSQQIAGTVG
jgi:Big-like domain-containing protein